MGRRRIGIRHLIQELNSQLLISIYSIEMLNVVFNIKVLSCNFSNHIIVIKTLPKLAFPANEPYLVWIDLVDPSLNRQIGIFKLANKSISPPAQALYDLCVAYIKLKRTAGCRQGVLR